MNLADNKPVAGCCLVVVWSEQLSYTCHTGKTIVTGSPPITPKTVFIKQEPMEDADLKLLADKIDLLLQRLRALEAENKTLVSNEKFWREERTRLIKRNELAQKKVEIIISRLKALEQNP